MKLQLQLLTATSELWDKFHYFCMGNKTGIYNMLMNQQQ